MEILKKAHKVMLTGILLYASIFTFGQNRVNDAFPLAIISDINRKEVHLGDTICFTIKNKTLKDRGYTIEVITSESQDLKIGYDAIYTAYFNSDSSFFIKLDNIKRMSRKQKVPYLMPDPNLTPHDIGANKESTFQFIVKGKERKKGIKVQFKIIPDLVDEESEVLILSKPFFLFAAPF